MEDALERCDAALDAAQRAAKQPQGDGAPQVSFDADTWRGLDYLRSKLPEQGFAHMIQHTGNCSRLHSPGTARERHCCTDAF
jgi:hypothetical protein